MSAPLDGVRSVSSVRAESSETTLTVVMGDESPLPKKRPVTAPPSSSSSRQHHHNEPETPEKHRPGGTHKSHQGEYRHTDAVVAARASLIAKERMKLDYCEDSGDDVSRTTMPDEESAKRNATETADKETAAVDQTGAAPGKGSGGAAGSAPANKFTLSDPHVMVRASRKGMRLNDPDEFFKSASPTAAREEVDTTPLLPVRRTSSMEKAQTPRENRASSKPSSGQQSIYASASGSSYHDTKTSGSDRTQPRAPANTRATTPASTRPSTQANTDAEGTKQRKYSRHRRKSLRQARKEQGTERVLALSRALRASSTPEDASIHTPVSTPVTTPPSTPPSTSVSTPPCRTGRVFARQLATKTEKRVESLPSSRLTSTPASTRPGSSKTSTQESVPEITHTRTLTIKPGSSHGSSASCRTPTKQVRAPVNTSINKAASISGRRPMSASAGMRPSAGFKKLQNTSTSLPKSVHVSIPPSPSRSPGHSPAEWSTTTQSSMPASSQRSIPENLPANVPSNVVENFPQRTVVNSRSVFDSPSTTQKAPPNLIKSSPECSPNSVVKCLPEANLLETNRPVNMPLCRPSSGSASRPGSSSTSSRQASRHGSRQIPRTPVKAQVSSHPTAPHISPENTPDRQTSRRVNIPENRRYDRPASQSENYPPGAPTEALANRLRSTFGSNDAEAQNKSTFSCAEKPPRILGNKTEMKQRFSTIPERTQSSGRLPSIVLLLDTDAFFQNSLSM